MINFFFAHFCEETTWSDASLLSLFSLFSLSVSLLSLSPIYLSITYSVSLFEKHQWNVAKVYNMNKLFYNSQKFNQNISLWDVGGVNPTANFNEVFRLARSFQHKTILDILWGEVSDRYPGNSMFTDSCALDASCGFCGKTSTDAGSGVLCSVAAQPRVEPFSTTKCLRCRNDGYECCNPIGCPAGSFRPAEATEAVCISMTINTCPAGEGFFSASATGTAVLTGSNLDDGLCTPCEEGTFKNHIGPEKCKICLPGMYQNDTNSKSCKLCPVGKSLTTAGTRLFHDSALDCEDCPIFSFSPLEGQEEECYPCLSATRPGASDCAGCHPGTWKNETGDCNVCPLGFFTAKQNVKVCASCPTGWFASVSKIQRDRCWSCPRGTFGSE